LFNVDVSSSTLLRRLKWPRFQRRARVWNA
jgi:hypothetical protein